MKSVCSLLTIAATSASNKSPSPKVSVKFFSLRLEMILIPWPLVILGRDSLLGIVAQQVVVLASFDGFGSLNRISGRGPSSSCHAVHTLLAPRKERSSTLTTFLLAAVRHSMPLVSCTYDMLNELWIDRSCCERNIKVPRWSFSVQPQGSHI